MRKIFTRKNMRQKEHILLLIIFSLSIFIRILLDPDIPYHFDPGKNIVYARAALQWFPLIPQYNPYFNLGEYYEYQVLFPYTVAFLNKISGASLISITKWLVIISGAALSLTVYYLSLEIFNNKTSALISAFLISVSKIQLMGYMNYYPQIMAMTIMLISFIFLIRYIKYGKFKYLILVAIMSSLIVLASYITAFVYFIVVLLSAGIYGIMDKKSFKLILIVPLMTGALLTFFWLPMIWRHGFMDFIKKALDIILNTHGDFTNQPWTLMNYLTFSNTTVIAVIMGIIAIFFIKKVKRDFQRLLLGVWLVFAFVLMESNNFKSILWVDRYYQFFDIALLLLAGSFLTFFIDKLNSIKKVKIKYKGYFLLLLLIFPLYGAVNVDFTFGRWGYPSDISMIEYMKTLPNSNLVAAPPSIHSFWIPALSGLNVLGGDSSQMMEHTYLGDGDSNLIINSPDVNQKMEIIRKYGINYIFIPVHKPVFMVWNPLIDRKGFEAFNNSTYFEIDKVFEDSYGATVLIKVKEDLKPEYNLKKIDWDVTIAGYLISIISLLIFFFWLREKSKVY